MYALEIFATKVLTTCKQSEPEKPGFFLSKPGLEPEPGFWKNPGFPPSLPKVIFDQKFKLSDENWVGIMVNIVIFDHRTPIIPN